MSLLCILLAGASEACQATSVLDGADGTSSEAVTAAALSVSPTSQYFLKIPLAQHSADLMFTVTNTGQSPSGIPSAVVSATTFRITSTTCNAGLAAGATCTFGVRFIPVVVGTTSGVLTVSATPGGSATASLSGIGTAILNVQNLGGGTVVSNPVKISCGTACSAIFPTTPVALTATPDATHRFAGWSGACSGTGACSVPLLTPTQTVTASFAPINGTPSADLSITVADAPHLMLEGGVVTYTIQVHNAGPDAATEVTVTDSLPATATYRGATASQGSCTANGADVTCSLGTVPSGGAATVSLVAMPTASGAMANLVTVASSVADPVTTNNSASVTTTVCGADNLEAAGCPPAVAAVASSSEGNYTPELTLDGDQEDESRWSGGGDAFLVYDLSRSVTIDQAELRFYRGGSVVAHFSIDTSTDGHTWTRVVTGQSSGATLGFESFPFTQAVTATHVRVNGGGALGGPAGVIETQLLSGGIVVVGHGALTVVECLTAAHCDDHDGTTLDQCSNVHACVHVPIACGASDGLCPSSCTKAQDLDCPPACLEGAVSSTCLCGDTTVTTGFACSGSCCSGVQGSGSCSVAGCGVCQTPIPSSLATGSTLVIDGTTVTDVQTGVASIVSIPRGAPISLHYTNNQVTAQNTGGYMLEAGFDVDSVKDNRLDGSVITGNLLTWTGTDPSVITHSLFVGYGINHRIEYNFLRNTPYGVVTKSSGMAYTSGGVAYNIVTDSLQPISMKGISGVKVLNNTLYDTRPVGNVTGLVKVYANQDSGAPGFPSTNGQIENDIFYTKFQVPNIYLVQSSRPGFVSDHNVFFCESGEPVFFVENMGVITFTQWQALGYDTHSVVVNPNFVDTLSLIPSAPLFYGEDMGPEWQDGLSPTTVWGSQPITARQGPVWQCGAYVVQ